MKKRILLRSTAMNRVVGAIRWLELFFVQGVRGGEWNTGPAIHWLIRQKHPMYYRIQQTPDGLIELACEQGLVSERLQINGLQPCPT